MRQTMLKNIPLILFSLSILLFINPGEARAQIIHGYKHSITQMETPIVTDVCLIPIFPSTLNPEQVIWVKIDYKIAFCVDVDGSIAINYKYSLQIDSLPAVDLVVNCYKFPAPVVCLSVIPDSMITPLQNDAKHIMNITVRDTTNIVIGSMALPVRKPVCNARAYEPFPQSAVSILVDKQFSIGSTLPAAVPGALRNQMGSATFESQIGILRDAGWHIEWQRVQFGLDSSVGNGYWYMLGWCEGK